MQHELLHAAAERRRQLPDRDASNFQQVRIVLDKVGVNTVLVSLLVTDVGRHRLQDTALGRWKIPLRDSAGRAHTPKALLRLALEAMD